MLKKTFKSISIICALAAGILALCTISQSDYEVEANVPVENRMSDKELYIKIGASLALLGISFGGMIYAHKDE